MDIVALPPASAAGRAQDLELLAHVLFDSADLLLEAQQSEDAQVRQQAVDTAVRALRAAASVIGGRAERTGSARPAAAVLPGPWPAARVRRAVSRSARRPAG